MKSLLWVHHTPQGVDIKPRGGDQAPGIENRDPPHPHPSQLSTFSLAQENPAKLSDQQETVSQGQNPYPIYASINVHKNISGDYFAGARM